jgi:hypothetical protein
MYGAKCLYKAENVINLVVQKYGRNVVTALTKAPG